MCAKLFYLFIYCKSWWIGSYFKEYSTWLTEIYRVKIGTIYNGCCVEPSFDYSSSQHFLLFIRRCAPSYMMYCSNTYHPILCIWHTKYVYDIRSMMLFF